MKKFGPFIPVIILLFSMGCEKEVPGPAPRPPFVNTAPPPVVNTAPYVSAGGNLAVLLPVDSAFLNGAAWDAENNLDSCSWRQLSGPSQAIIQIPDLYKTKISRLIKGEYSFELTVTDYGGLRGKDTANIVVIDPLATNNMIFQVIDVTCFGSECTLVVDTLNTIRNVPLKVFLKSTDSSVWVEIPRQNYYYRLNSSGFWIEWYGLNDAKKWEVMIVY